ncbi:MAG: thiamine-phosphate kinase [candidate division KSB1 bacterium]|nr:thiamine-phosphate kinase [candidate division KSB1 bacterium]
MGKIMVAQPTVSDIGEFGLIARLQRFIPKFVPSGVITGIGDDAAVIRLDDQREILVTCDIQIEGQHFRSNHLSRYQLGRRAAAVNLSDIAAMGGKPLCALTSLAFPQSLPLVDFDDLYRGICDQLAEFSAAIIGGNLAQSDCGLIIDITLIGMVEFGQFLLRSGAKPNDRIFVTGPLGASAAGFAILEHYGPAFPKQFDPLVQKHLQPIPRIAAGQMLAQCGFATAMIDISDGLAGDLQHILAASQVGAELYQYRIPLPDLLLQACELVNCSVWDIVLYGGEDYELLVTMKPETPDALLATIAQQCNISLFEIGCVRAPEAGCFLIDSKGKKISIEAKAWDHFSHRSISS